MAENILILESELKMPLLPIPVKCTLVKVKDKVVMISPFPRIQKFKKQIEEFGAPTDIVAPNGYHHLGVKAAQELFPQAKLWCSPILKDKRADVSWDSPLDQDWPYEENLKAIPIEGMPKIQEFVFYDVASKTLIVTDLFFNHINGEGIGYWIIFKIFGTFRRFGISKFFFKFVTDKSKFKSSMESILAFDIERIIIPHGVNVTESPKDKIRASLQERNI